MSDQPSHSCTSCSMGPSQANRWYRRIASVPKITVPPTVQAMGLIAGESTGRLSSRARSRGTENK